MNTLTSILSLSAFSVASLATTAHGSPLGLFDGHADVGTPTRAGSAAYHSSAQEYQLEGSGTNIWFGRDEFHFAWKQLHGDFIVRTEGRFIGNGVDPHRKLGWMIRSDLQPDSAHVSAVVHGDGLTSLQFRRSRGAETEEIRSLVSGADVIQLERTGTAFRMSVARFGEPFSVIPLTGPDLGDGVQVGLFICSHNPDVSEQAVFRNVRIVLPAPAGFAPYRDYIGSNLEVLDVETGRRRIVYRTEDSMQAPNWTPDGSALLYNRGGRMWRFDLESGSVTRMDTGAADALNNDHVLSFDGRWLGISHHSREDGGHSMVYVVPSEGGEPRRVTARGPSYLHGWSPDGHHLIYTGEREGEFDIYRIPVEGGEEERLTGTKGLDDGSEYGPDGRFIYFNSARTGTMQIWRMNADGSGAHPLTNDSFNNWFPHVSPDGRRVVFLSFAETVDAEEHPFYQQVYLRMMPAEGGRPQVVAYVYGGQGTINVPSWAPDSRRLAFVSNSRLE